MAQSSKDLSCLPHGSSLVNLAWPFAGVGGDFVSHTTLHFPWLIIQEQHRTSKRDDNGSERRQEVLLHASCTATC